MYKIKLTTADCVYYYGQEREGFLTKDEPTGFETIEEADKKIAELTIMFNFDPAESDEDGELKSCYTFEIVQS